MIAVVRRAVFRGVLAGALGCALVAGPVTTRPSVAFAASVASAPFTPAVAAEVKGIPRFHEIEPGFARGGQPNGDGYRFLRDHGYRTVISFRKNDDERRELARLGINYVEIPMHAGLFSASTPTEEDLQRFFATVGDSAQRPVFIHCRYGKDRTGAMTALYRVQSCGWSNEEAIREMKERGFSGHYKKLMRFVREYVPHTTSTASSGG
jgi:protein tyrosine/serine phosphatase